MKVKRIALVGDYSGYHLNVMTGIEQFDHTCKVHLYSDGDSYKDLPRTFDLGVKKKYNSKIMISLYYALYLLGVTGLFCLLRNIKTVNKIRDYDVVQLINPVIIPAFGGIGNLIFFILLRKRNDKLSLAAVGDDASWLKANLANIFEVSIFDKVGRQRTSIKQKLYSYKYRYSPIFYVLDWIVCKKCDKIISALDDYAIPYNSNRKHLAVRGIPVDTKLFRKKLHDPRNQVQILHAFQVGKEFRKGNDVFVDIIKRLELAFPEEIKIHTVSNVSYSDFLMKIDECDVVLDQLYSLDRGMIGCLAMAKSCVVVSGFRAEDDIGAAKPKGIAGSRDPSEVFVKLSTLISNKKVLREIQKNAYQYALSNYNSESYAKRLMQAWTSSRQYK